MKNEPFIIATNVDFEDPLEKDLHNLKLRLKIQQGWVEQTEAQIEDLEERIANNKGLI